jgi:radical SAM superfamily enzyme YgiQ (UPF0313 family)
MHLTLVKPNLGHTDHHGSFVDAARMEPLNLGLLAGLTPAGIDLTLFDDRVDPFDPDTPTDLVAITVEAFTARRAYEIADAYRARGVPVVLGGIHPTLLPDEAALHADAVVLGEAEGVWGELLADAHARRLAPRYRAARVGVPQGDLRPRRDLYAGKGYLPLALLQFGRGCAYRCDFCAVGAVAHGRHGTRPLAAVLAEVAEIRAGGRRDLFFVDDNLVADPVALKELLRALIPLRMRWVSQASLEHTHDPELLDLFAASGCLGNVIGFESLSPASLREAHKGPNLLASPRYAAEVEALRAHHLQTWAAFVLGFDHDTVDSLLETCEWAVAQRFAFAAFNLLTPYPGTPLYRRLAAQQRLLYDGVWWLHPDYRFNDAAFEPARMSADALTEVAWRCRRRWSSPASILQRAFDPATHLHSLRQLVVYARYNPLFRREMAKKQGLRLGMREG